MEPNHPVRQTEIRAYGWLEVRRELGWQASVLPCWPICEFGWHVLTIGKGVGIAINSENHALPDRQGRANHACKLKSNF